MTAIVGRDGIDGGTRVPHLGEVTAVVPVRNAERLLVGCLRSLRDNGITKIVVVDGESTDASREVASEHGATVLADGGGGLPLARSMGVREARTRWVILVDADVVVPDGALGALLREYHEGRYAALQAGLHSVAGPGYWGQALARHHLSGRSRWWFGLMATVVEREVLLEHGFDDAFRSGEDIELRWRLTSAGLKVGVSRDVLVEHRFAADDFGFAKDQFLMDGTGLGLMLRKHGWRGSRLAGLPLAAAVRGAALSLAHGEPRWCGYYAAYCWYNYVGMYRSLSR
jgi:glycosyltransferase involved in cell wall biosynthesis